MRIRGSTPSVSQWDSDQRPLESADMRNGRLHRLAPGTYLCVAPRNLSGSAALLKRPTLGQLIILWEIRRTLSLVQKR